MHTAKTNTLLPFLILMYLYFLLIHLSVLVEFLVYLLVWQGLTLQPRLLSRSQ